MDDAVSRAEHNEFAKRIEEANRRQDKRLEALENTMGLLHTLTASVEKLAMSMERMMEEQKKQGSRLETLESRDGEMWRSAISHIATAVIGAGVTIVLAKLGLL